MTSIIICYVGDVYQHGCKNKYNNCYTSGKFRALQSKVVRKVFYGIPDTSCYTSVKSSCVEMDGSIEQ